MSQRDDSEVPIGLVYAATQSQPLQVVRIPVEGTELLVAAIEPGHDPVRQWRDLRGFLEAEGVLYVAPGDPSKEPGST